MKQKRRDWSQMEISVKSKSATESEHRLWYGQRQLKTGGLQVEKKE